MLDDAFVEELLDDTFRVRRRFLPGPACGEDDVRRNLGLPIMFDGLSDEESALLLSALPRGVTALLVSEMDKGLSGARVLQGRYLRDDGHATKPFVLKFGDPTKIEREVEAMEGFVAPLVPGAVPPIYRKGRSISLVVQELAGMGRGDLQSLREYVRTQGDGSRVVTRLFRDRLHRWYAPNAEPVEAHLGEVFAWYMAKAGSSTVAIPTDWSALEQWVAEISGYAWLDPLPLVRAVQRSAVRFRPVIVHGDLHSQNIVVDTTTKECWPIDFAWCHDGSTPIVDYVMLECSLKFLALPMRSDLRAALAADLKLLHEPTPTAGLGPVPYGKEMARVFEAVKAVREHALTMSGITFDEYRRGLLLMTYAHANHSGLNRPLVLGSLQMLTGVLREGA